MAVLRDSTLYDKLNVKKYLGAAYEEGGRLVPHFIDFTVVAGGVVGDTYNLTVIKANERVISLEAVVTVAFGATVTLSIGDAGDPDRFVATGTSVATLGLYTRLAATGMHYTPTADTIVIATVEVAGGVGGRLQGVIMCVPGA